MTRAAIEAAFKRNSLKGKMSVEGFVQALEELNQTPYAFNLQDKVKGLTVEECRYSRSRGVVYSVRDASGSTFEIGEIELLTLNNKR